MLSLALYFDLSAAYDTVNHRLLLTKLYGITEDAEFTKSGYDNSILKQKGTSGFFIFRIESSTSI